MYISFLTRQFAALYGAQIREKTVVVLSLKSAEPLKLNSKERFAKRKGSKKRRDRSS